MPVEVTARRLEAGADLQAYAKRKGEEVMAAFPGVEHVHVILDHEKHRNIAEVVVQAKHHVRAEATETSDNIRLSIDVAMERVEKQLRRVHDKVRDHKAAMKHTEVERMRGGEES